MKTVRLVCARTLSAARSYYSAGIAAALFLSVSTVRFALSLDGGSHLPVQALWAAAAAPILPFLCVVSTMRLWTRERESGALELFLSAPVSVRALAVGKFAGAWMSILTVLVLYLAAPLVFLPFFGGARAGFSSYAWGFAGLALQAALWCSAGCFTSAFCKHSSSSGAASLLVTVCLPYAAFRAVLAWAPELRASIGDLPQVEFAIDAATGFFPAASVAVCVFFTAAFLSAASHSVESQRCAGRGTRHLRAMHHACSLLGFVLAALASAVFARTGMAWESAPLGKEDSAFMLRAFDSARGGVRAVCFMRRADPRHHAAARVLRGLSDAARRHGADVETVFADPDWDFGIASALSRDGIPEGSIVFERARRRISIPAQELFGGGTSRIRAGDIDRAVRVCASAVSNLKPRRGHNAIYALAGHGESSFSDQGVYGLGRFARWLRYDGFAVKTLDLSSVPSVPSDCCAVAVCGARGTLTEGETAKLDAYLQNGGRLLAFVLPRPGAGLAPYLRRWGCRVTSAVAVTPPPMSGTSVKTPVDGDHPIAGPLHGSSLFFEQAAVLEPEGAGGPEADRMVFAPLASTSEDCWGETDLAARPWMWNPDAEPRGGMVLAAALERGGSAGADLAFRPVRIVVVGDAGFAMNSSLEKRGSANLDFMLNAVRWLAGAETAAPPPDPAPAPPCGYRRWGFLSAGAFAFPFAVLAFTAFRAFRTKKGLRR